MGQTEFGQLCQVVVPRDGGQKGEGPKGGGPRDTLTKEPKRALWVDFEPRAQFHERTPKRGEVRSNFAAGEGKRAKFWAVQRRAGPAEGH